ncbi:Hypothetical predicted protein [Lecanosticta acicola]|uniref:Uncharacterized protein n=1 Tax=Lecanosticta acicola TaxID=111012 RepID=A0AAI9E7Y2_9PEZI|nr:Hypothetical predicted protein [Lecanosticta acicola]
MAHLFILPPDIPLTTTANARTNPYRRRPSAPQQQHHPPSQAQAQAQFQDENLIDLDDPRTDSVTFSLDGSYPPSPSETGYDPAAAAARRNSSALAAHRNPSSISSQQQQQQQPQQQNRTRSPGGALTPNPNPEPSANTNNDDNDIIIVTVRLTNTFRKSSISPEACTELPSRPPRRGFLQRMTTRIHRNWDHSAEKEERYKAVKMPRGEYRRYFARDRERNFSSASAGSGEEEDQEGEREWDEDELMGRYAVYQEMPLSRVVVVGGS